MIGYHLISIVLAIVIDRIFGDPRWLPHPVVGIGKLIKLLDDRLNKGRGRKSKGSLLVIVVLFVVGGLVFAITFSAFAIHPVIGIIVEAILISLTIASKGLKDAAMEVYQPLEQNNLIEARVKLSYIVGRDTEHLSESEIVRGTVETVAENTSDGITAPLFYALFGGALFAFLYRAINTCDSMVGYKSEKYLKFGWASARLDDVVNLIPSRITGILMLLTNESTYSKRECWRTLFRDAKRHPSPNSGWGEAAVSGLLGIQLGGRNSYQGVISNRPTIGIERQQLQKEHILRTIEIMHRTLIGFVFVICMVGGLIYVFT